MRLSRLLLSAAVLLAFLAGFTSGQMYQPPDFVAEYIYHPMLTCIVRIYEFCKNVKGGWKGELMRRSAAAKRRGNVFFSHIVAIFIWRRL